MPTPVAPALEAVIRAIGADYHRVVKWLLTERKAIDIEDAQGVLAERGPEGLEAYALMLVHELLKPSVQRAGQRLSALRGPQLVNGAIGGFHIVPQAPPLASGATAAEVLGQVMEELAVGEEAVGELEACGFLQPVDPSRGRAVLQMPSPVRFFLRRLARLEEPHVWSSDNRALGGRPIRGAVHRRAARSPPPRGRGREPGASRPDCAVLRRGFCGGSRFT